VSESGMVSLKLRMAYSKVVQAPTLFNLYFNAMVAMTLGFLCCISVVGNWWGIAQLRKSRWSKASQTLALICSVILKQLVRSNKKAFGALGTLIFSNGKLSINTKKL